MVSFLVKRFIRNYRDTADPKVRQAYGMLMSIIGIAANVALSASKLLIGAFSSSISITADGLNNFSDALSQIISLISFKISAKPADREHPFGHARMEYVASMIVSFLILLVGVELGKESFFKILHPVEAEFSMTAALVLVISILTKLWMGISQKRVAKIIHSPVIQATAADSFTDVLATSAVLISALICRFTPWNIDAYMGLAVAVMIFVAGLKMLDEAKNYILGTSPDPELEKAILSIVQDSPDILGVHDLVVHSYGAGNMIASVHAEVDGSHDVYYIHEAVDKIEKRLLRELGVQATIHMDPTEAGSERASQLYQLVSEAARLIDGGVCIHDFRFRSNGDRPVLSFDLVIPYELKRAHGELCSAMQDTVSQVDPEILCEITVDRR